jgi:lysozyme
MTGVWGELVHIARASAGLPDAPASDLRTPDATWRMSPEGVRALAHEEGRKLEAYRDTKGIWTIGVGHTAACGAPIPKPGLVITEADCDAALARDIASFESCVSGYVTAPINQTMFDALVRLTFNIGCTGFRNSTVLARLNAGDFEGAAKAILMWSKPAEIRGRRWREHRDFAVAANVPFIEEEHAYV